MNKNSQIIHRISRVALFSALSFCFSFFFKIPYANGGYFNFGDVVIILSGLCFGPFDALIVGLLGGCLSDLVGGYFVYLPFTAISKAILGLLTGFLRLSYKKIPLALSIILGLFYPILALLPYLFGYAIILGWASYYLIFFDMIQEYVCLLLAHAAFYFLSKTPLNLLSPR